MAGLGRRRIWAWWISASFKFLGLFGEFFVEGTVLFGTFLGLFGDVNLSEMKALEPDFIEHMKNPYRG